MLRPGKILLLGLSLLLYLSASGQDSLAIKALDKKIYESSYLIFSDVERAKEEFQDCIDEARRLKAYTYYASAYNGLVYAWFRKEEDFEYAYQLSQIALDSIGKYLPENSPYFADAMANLANFFTRIGEVKQAQRYLRKSIEINLAAENPESYALSANYYLLGLSSLAEGDWLTCIAYYQQAITLRLEDADKPALYYSHIPNCYVSLGRALREVGKYEKGIKAYKEALLSPGVGQKATINACYGLGFTFVEMGNLDSARYYLQQAEIINEASSTPWKPQNASEIKGRIYTEEGDHAAAMMYFKQAQALRLIKRKHRFQDLARGERLIAEGFRNMNEFDSAHVHLDQALRYLGGTSNTTPPYGGELESVLFLQDAIPVMIERGRSYLAAYSQSKAKSKLQQVMKSCDETYAIFLKLRKDRWEEANKLILNQSMKGLYEVALEGLYLLYQEDPKTKYMERALIWMERYHAGALRAERQKIRKWEAMPDSTVRREEEFRIAISTLRKQLQEARLIEEDTLGARKLKQSLFEKQEAYKQFLRTVSLDWVSNSTEEDAVLQRDLKDRTKFLSGKSRYHLWFEGEKYNYVLELEPDKKLKLIQFEATEEQKRLIIQFNDLITSRESSPASLEQYQELGFKLYQSCFQQRLEESSVSHLVIIPDGIFTSLPFGALVVEKKEATSFRDLEYLGKSLSLGYGSSILMLKRQQVSKSLRGELALLAPVYEGKLSIPQNAELFPALTGEVPTQDCSQFLKQDFVSQASEYQMLHLALHGTSDTINSTKAFLQFPLDETDNRLYSHEIYNLRFQGSLISLASCEVGDGRLATGEGLMSLGRAFRYAGASTVLSSRWKADARVTGRIFPSFYRYLADGKKSGEAFSLAQRDFLREAAPSLVHPYYWANFAHWGEDYEGNSTNWYWYLIVGMLVMVGAAIWYFRKKYQ